MVSATKPEGMGRYSDCDPSAWLAWTTTFDVIACPDRIVTKGIMPWTSVILVKKTDGELAGIGIRLMASEAASIGGRGFRSAPATTTDWYGTLVAVPAFRATSTKAPITSKARMMPRKVNGRLEVRALKVLKADPS